ncbi:hypothetical protein BDN72DRAFT_802855 [Pluteus cervinus]|uniref:Uncharacterized protein n=1 Tax=Pluteus cervinus TaxID=181527 RepID=A0ACD3AEY5_9AGAR|nr:hypothetical protein BDN72DRAFT_802855 [Pluteus cervinus]
MASSNINDKVEQDIRDSYVQSQSIGDVSRVEQVYDRAAKLASGPPKDGLFESLKSFFDANQETITSTATALTSLTSEGKSIESAVSSFTETAKVVIKGLDALAQVHPAIGVAVIAFKLVVTFDMTRRENNKKILALKIEMQDMMVVLFELRHIRDPMEEGPDGSPLGARIQTLMEKVATNIKNAGAACDAYLKKSFLARTLKSKIYEGRLADYGAAFEHNKTELHRALTMHTARGVDAANEKLNSVDNKVDQLLQIFRTLDSPQEKEVQNLFDENGGEKACIEDDELLKQLVSKSGETLSSVGGLTGKGEDLGHVRKVLLKEWQEDVGKMFNKNMVVFARKLDVQSKQLDAIKELNERIVTILNSGSHEKILDHDLRAIWKEMDWKGSVKARYFVLALHDYYSDESFLRGPESNITPRNAFAPTESIAPTAPTNADNRWALAYVNVAHVQPILEAIDDDGSGFVSIREVNTFVTSHPLDWTLLQRLAFWAAGWHISVSSYKNKIYALVRKMFELRGRVIGANRNLVEAYLKSQPLAHLERILRSTKSVEAPRHDPALAGLVDEFERMEEDRLSRNLSSIAYEVDTVETVGLVTGPGRIERYLFPLIYLLLQRDLRIIMLACRCLLREDELLVGLSSVRSVFSVADERLQRITGIFKQVRANVDTGLGLFAFGMFQLYYDKVHRPDQIHVIAQDDNSFIKWKPDPLCVEGDTDLQDEIDSVPISELHLGPFDATLLEEGLTDFSNLDTSEVHSELSPLGTWSGHLWTITEDGEADTAFNLIELRIDTVSNGVFLGTGQTMYHPLACKGTIAEENRFKFDISYKDWFTVQCEVAFDPLRQRIEGSWGDNTHSLMGSERQDVSRSLLFLRIPARLHQFYDNPIDFAKSPARSRWNFACQAILHENRRKSWSWIHLRSRIRETRRFVTLLIRDRLFTEDATPNTELTDEEMEELLAFQQNFDVRMSRLCVALARFHTHRLMVDHMECICNSCNHKIYETRIICLVCLQKDLVNSVDLCKPCLTASFTHDGRNHNPSHSMIKYEHVVYDYDEVLYSRTVAGYAKAILTQPEEAPKDKGDGEEAIPDQDTFHEPRPCICCSKEVTLPCWFCRTCSAVTLICSSCEEMNMAPPKDHPHKLSDPLIRISTTDPDPLTGVDELSLEAKLDKKAAERTAELETRVKEQLTELETRVGDRLALLETRIQDKFSSLESLLRQIVTQASAQITPS